MERVSTSMLYCRWDPKFQKVRAHCLTAQRAEEQDHDQRLAKKIIFYSFSIESPTFLHASIFSPSIDSCNVQSDAQTHSLSLSLSLLFQASPNSHAVACLKELLIFVVLLWTNYLFLLQVIMHSFFLICIHICWWLDQLTLWYDCISLYTHQRRWSLGLTKSESHTLIIFLLYTTWLFLIVV